MKNILLFIMIISTILHAQDIEKMLVEADKSWLGVKDFTASFHKKELVKDQLIEANNIQMKMVKPLKVYMKWTEGDDEGQEIIFNEAKYGKKLQAHGGGWLNVINVSLYPEGAQAMKKSRHSIYDSGIGHILGLVKKNYELSKKLGKGSITFIKEELFDGKKSYLFQADLPDGFGFYAKKILVNLDFQTKLPIKITVYGFKNEFLEYYAFTKLKLNAGLTENDFDMENSSYKF